VHFAAGLPGWTWQPSDPDAAARASIAGWVEAAALPNLRAPIEIDVMNTPWAGVGSVDAIFCANMLHISPWATCAALMRGAAQHLSRDGLLLTYGPYFIDGQPPAEGNLAFDADLRARNAAWGVRRLADVVAEAARCGLALREHVAMPANNFTLVFERSARSSQTIPTPEQAIAETRAWVDHAVIGLNLCPFAKAVQTRNQIRYVVSDATDADSLLAALCDELTRLAGTPADEIDTTLLIHPWALADFVDFNDFLDAADAAVAALGLEGVLQVASFHPDYRFAGTEPDDVTNATNRSPYPTLHLLREDSVARAVAAFPQSEAIFENNIRTLRRLGPDAWAALRLQCKADALK